MSITNAVLQNWPLNRDNFLNLKNIYISRYFFLWNYIRPKTSDYDFSKKKYLNQSCLMYIYGKII